MAGRGWTEAGCWAGVDPVEAFPDSHHCCCASLQTSLAGLSFISYGGIVSS